LAEEVAGAALRLQLVRLSGVARVGEGLAAAKVGGGGRLEAGEAIAEAGRAEAGDGDAWVEPANGRIHTNVLTCWLAGSIMHH
jgi:hypothetical protein